MKAKDLINILKKFPEAEVGFMEYIGYDTPFVSVHTATLYQKNTFVGSIISDGGYQIDKNKKTKIDIILLTSDAND